MFKTIKEKLSWETFENSVSETIERFPLAVVYIAAAFFAATILLHSAFENGDHLNTLLVQMLVTSLFGGLLSVALVLTQESFSITRKAHQIGGAILVTLVTLLYFWSLPDHVDIVSTDTVLVYVFLNVLVLLSISWSRFSHEIAQESYKDNLFFLY